MSSKICTKCLTNTKTYATHTEQKPRLKAGVLDPKDFDNEKEMSRLATILWCSKIPIILFAIGIYKYATMDIPVEHNLSALMVVSGAVFFELYILVPSRVLPIR